jgi:exosortase A
MHSQLNKKISTYKLQEFSQVTKVLVTFVQNNWALLLVLLAQFLIFNTAWKAFYKTWTSQDFSYGMAIIPISLFLVWRLRDSLFGLPSLPSYAALVGVCVGAAAWFAGHITATASVMQFGVIIAGIFTVLAFVGFKIGRVIWFPLFFLLMILPFGGWLTPYLTEWTADAVHVGLRVIGIPVYREGDEFVLPTGRWSVIGACSGLRFLLSAIVLSVLFAHLNYRKLRTSLIFIAVAVLASIFSNWIRAIVTVLTGHATHMRFGPGEEHLWFGWVVFGLVMWATFWFASRWQDTDMPVLEQPVKSTRSPVKTSIPLGVFFAVAFICAGFGWSARSLVAPASSELISAFGKQTVSSSSEIDKIIYEPSFVGASSSRRGVVLNGESQFLTLLFAGQANSVSMLSLPNQVTPDEEKDEWKMRSIQVRTSSDLGFSFREFVAVSQKNTVRVQYWYTVGGVHTVSPVKAKFLTLKNVLAGKGDSSVLNLVLHKRIEATKSSDADEAVLLKSIAENSSVLTSVRR